MVSALGSGDSPQFTFDLAEAVFTGSCRFKSNQKAAEDWIEQHNSTDNRTQRKNPTNENMP